jgi:hypothetical protein
MAHGSRNFLRARKICSGAKPRLRESNSVFVFSRAGFEARDQFVSTSITAPVAGCEWPPSSMKAV